MMKQCVVEGCTSVSKTRGMCNKHYLRYWKSTKPEERPSSLEDLTGRRFGRLTVLEKQGVSNDRQQVWHCRCSCGAEIDVPGGHLKSGHTRSCGCLAEEMHIEQLKTHGLTVGGKPRLFTIWVDMRARCNNPRSVSYPHYGARGIKVCKEWSSFASFYAWAMSHGYSDDLQIDRIDNNGGYGPSNCRWVTSAINNRNTSRNHYITINGVTKTITDWITEAKIPQSTAYGWLRKGQQYFVGKFLGDRQEQAA